IVDGHVVQKVHDKVEFKVEVKVKVEEETHSPYSPYSPYSPHSPHLPKDIIQGFIRPFNLSLPPLLRVGFIETNNQEYIFMVDMHHIISDGVSIGIMIQDFIRLYQGMKLPLLRIQYNDFTRWQNKLFHSDVMQQQEEYWNKKFNNEQGVPLLTMPLDCQRPETMTFTGDTVTSTLTGELMEPLNRLAQEESVTLNILLLAIYTLLVSRYSGQEEVVIGSLVSGRPHPDLEEVIGLFVNFLPIRNAVDDGLAFKEFLGSVKNSALAAYQNQDYPFEEMVKQADLPDYPAINAVNPLFSTMFLFHSESDRTFEGRMETLEFYDVEFKDATSTLDFKLDVYPILSPEPELYCRLEYNTNLFKKDTMEQFLNRFRQLVETVIANPQQKLTDFQVFTETEEQQISRKRESFELEEKTKVRLAAAATFTAEPIQDYIVYWGNEYQMDIRVEFTP
ncbi:MAG: hypothetical protein GTO45_18460, partial [Candidatus Aminicenantes bacterium]|nr:hypothetical protein [Candidatus Aminicenantes bacterium]NIM80772.1 hypothetical protein [Candidatus Aminicenantes bacterium]NIN20167.1 hypothetical protein [Candidatus Aminicenantes bacterium]NIN43934.1 hypothetical protein [Candidatus Aminicenantes bacterium]NIN86743.1 hypothetical protein [Candidatus Aminicenantes bacterium]